MNLKNCESCGAVFVDPIRNICRDCYYKEEEAFRKVYQFLQKKRNREATIPEISKETGVEEQLIVKFMKQKRLRASQFPKLVYPCEGCGVDIVEGKYCTSCAAKLRQEISRHEELERTELEKQREAERVYYTINRERDKK